jgi:rfaE bifunctional protein kinase chain/domain
MNTREILGAIANLEVLVVGDICLDRWCQYEPGQAEPSRETGLPRIAVTATEITPGAGGTIANNLVALKVKKVAVLGAVGRDGFGWELLEALAARGIDSEHLVQSSEIPTFCYTKLINRTNGVEDLPRVDFIAEKPLPKTVEQQVLDSLHRAFTSHQVVLVSDQAETESGGIVTTAVREGLNDLARRHPEKVIWVDSRKRAELFRHVVLKPNQDEAEAASQRAYGHLDLARMRTDNVLRALITTYGDRGARIFDDEGEHWVAGRKVNAVDICGAGDSFSAGAACALAVTGSPTTAAQFGNIIASITVTKHGTGTASPEEVLSAVGS